MLFIETLTGREPPAQHALSARPELSLEAAVSSLRDDEISTLRQDFEREMARKDDEARAQRDFYEA